MARLGRITLLLATTAALVAPTAAHASCTSGYPAADKHLANYDCTGIHPGMGLHVPSKKYGELDCAAGFVFADQYGNRYVSVPGTCFLDYTCLEDVVVDELPPPLNGLVDDLVPCLLPSDSELEPVYTHGPAVTDFAGTRIGAIVYAVNKGDLNFALIRIDKGLKVDPAVPLYGGPTRLAGPNGVEEAYVFSARYNDFQPNAGTGVLYANGGRTYHAPGLLLGMPGSPVVKPDGSGVGYYSGVTYVGAGAEVVPYGPALSRTELHAKLKLGLVTASAS